MTKVLFAAILAVAFLLPAADAFAQATQKQGVQQKGSAAKKAACQAEGQRAAEGSRGNRGVGMGAYQACMQR